ncbi:MAG: hypothetical protein QFE16_16985 [Pseudomonadota bacterium]|nr:hypothetical protein [Pseudomonadota bacterium]
MFPKSKAATLLWAIAGLQLVLVSAPNAAQAQAQATAPASPAPAGARADPADPKAPVPAAPYVSPLRAYQGFAEPQVAPWRETNELVRQRGGWRAYAREAREPDAAKSIAPAASQPASAAKPAPTGHVGHEMK